jgi:mannosyltransferase OCH1-like enzyme
MSIPHIIHQTVRDKKTLEPIFSDNISSLTAINEGWDIVLYDDKDIYSFISSNYDKDILDSYLTINPRYGAAKADFFRYLLLYRYGGVYLDIKSTATRKLDEVIRPDDSYLLSYWANKKGEPYEGWGIHGKIGVRGSFQEFQQWQIVAAPEHPFLERVIMNVNRNIKDYNVLVDGVGKNAVMNVTGPIAYTKSIRPLLDSAAFRLVDIRTLGFVYSIFDPDNKMFSHGMTLPHEKLFKDHYRYLSEPLVQRLSRNSPCPCGSGERYKNCHGRF